MFHTPPHKVASHLPQAGTIENQPFAGDPRVIVNPDHDVEVSDHGSVFIIQPISESARDWLSFELPDNCPRWAGGYAVEARFIADIVDGMRDFGLKVAA